MPVGTTIAAVVKTAAAVGSVAKSRSDDKAEDRKDVKEQNKDGYTYGGSVSSLPIGRRGSRSRAAAQNGTAKRALLFGSLALVTWLAVR